LNALFPVEPTMLMVVAAGGAAVVVGEGVEGLDDVDGVVGVPPPLPPPHPRVSTQIISDRCFIMPRGAAKRVPTVLGDDEGVFSSGALLLFRAV
jgi:hypothetical protein